MSRPLRVLVVDDNEEFCDSMADVVELKGHDTAVAYDGFKAVELAQQNSFDLILMDVRMPGMDGVETFKRIKEDHSAARAIMVTAYAVEGLIDEAVREGVLGILRKPVDFDELFLLIGKATEDSAEARG